MIQHSKWYSPSDSFGQYRAEMLLYSFYGGIDAGDVGAMVVEQLLSSLPHRSVAKFALENVLDYRSRRPRLVIENWHITDMQVPTCELLEITDYSGKKFLLLHGVEPDINWLDFSVAILEVVKECGVQRAIDIVGVASNMPHTRMPFIHHTAPENVQLPEQSQAPGNFVFTATFGQYLQICLQKSGISSRGMLVGVPYYLADSQFPPGSVASIEFLNKQFNLDLPLGDLAAASSHMQNELNRQIGGNEEVSQMIAMLEQHYDKSTPNEWGNLPGGRIGVSSQITDGDKIAERLEKFLRDVDLGKGGSEFKDMKREQNSETRPTAPVPTTPMSMVPAVPPVAPTTNIPTIPEPSKLDLCRGDKSRVQTEKQESADTASESCGSEKQSVSRGGEEMPPIFKQMFAEKNPYEIWNRPTTTDACEYKQTGSSASVDSAKPADLASDRRVTPSLPEQNDLGPGENITWIPRQGSTGKRYPRRRLEDRGHNSQLYPWRKRDF